ncbi:hypothetical protein K438DRAFT_1994908 [Mycena galopus ATCC 62051]|nr:hypothetical protein K438DRAFT_1994908 [Mycena galopus ATCC 62051]
MAGMSAEEAFQVKFILGPWLIGGCLELVLMGVLSCQFVNYFNWYPGDSRGLRVTVAILCLLSVLKSAESFAAMWIFLIRHFGDLQYDIQLSATGWWDTANPLMVAIIDFYVQCYFCSRLWAVSKKSYIVAPILILFVFALASMILGTYYIAILDEGQVTNWFAAHLSSVFAGDFILCVTMAYFLIKTKKNAFSAQTASLIHALIRLTFQTAAPAALFTMFTLIFSQMNRVNNPLVGYVEIAFNQPLPKLYAISMMYTLNTRRTTATRNGAWSSGSDQPSGGRARAQHRNNEDMELGRIEVVTETTRHVDVTGMFQPTQSLEDSKVAFSDPDHNFPPSQRSKQG